MSTEDLWPDSIIIVGAPRSGTSLLQRVIRGSEGFASVAKESGFIWREYTHPARHQWHAETWQENEIDDAEVDRIRRRFARYALPASVWRQVDEHDVLRYQRVPLVSALLRPAYHMIAGLRAMMYRLPEGTRLVDKSVHSALWLGLVDRVFDRPRFLHIVRDPRRSVESMAAAWRNPNRFFTYKVPATLSIPGYRYKYWNFALPPGWRDYTSSTIETIATYQWTTLQRSILSYTRKLPDDRYLRIHLEDLSTHPREVLEQVCEWGGIAFDSHMEKYARGMPKVNARDREGERETSREIRDELADHRDLIRELGYRL